MSAADPPSSDDRLADGRPDDATQAEPLPVEPDQPDRNDPPTPPKPQPAEAAAAAEPPGSTEATDAEPATTDPDPVPATPEASEPQPATGPPEVKLGLFGKHPTYTDYYAALLQHGEHRDFVPSPALEAVVNAVHHRGLRGNLDRGANRHEPGGWPSGAAWRTNFQKRLIWFRQDHLILARMWDSRDGVEVPRRFPLVVAAELRHVGLADALNVVLPLLEEINAFRDVQGHSSNLLAALDRKRAEAQQRVASLSGAANAVQLPQSSLRRALNEPPLGPEGRGLLSALALLAWACPSRLRPELRPPQAAADRQASLSLRLPVLSGSHVDSRVMWMAIASWLLPPPTDLMLIEPAESEPKYLDLIVGEQPDTDAFFGLQANAETLPPLPSLPQTDLPPEAWSTARNLLPQLRLSSQPTSDGALPMHCLPFGPPRVQPVTVQKARDANRHRASAESALRWGVMLRISGGLVALLLVALGLMVGVNLWFSSADGNAGPGGTPVGQQPIDPAATDTAGKQWIRWCQRYEQTVKPIWEDEQLKQRLSRDPAVKQALDKLAELNEERPIDPRESTDRKDVTPENLMYIAPNFLQEPQGQAFAQRLLERFDELETAVQSWSRPRQLGEMADHLAKRGLTAWAAAVKPISPQSLDLENPGQLKQHVSQVEQLIQDAQGLDAKLDELHAAVSSVQATINQRFDNDPLLGRFAHALAQQPNLTAGSTPSTPPSDDPEAVQQAIERQIDRSLALHEKLIDQLDRHWSAAHLQALRASKGYRQLLASLPPVNTPSPEPDPTAGTATKPSDGPPPPSNAEPPGDEATLGELEQALDRLLALLKDHRRLARQQDPRQAFKPNAEQPLTQALDTLSEQNESHQPLHQRWATLQREADAVRSTPAIAANRQALQARIEQWHTERERLWQDVQQALLDPQVQAVLNHLDRAGGLDEALPLPAYLPKQTLRQWWAARQPGTAAGQRLEEQHPQLTKRLAQLHAADDDPPAQLLARLATPPLTPALLRIIHDAVADRAQQPPTDDSTSIDHLRRIREELKLDQALADAASGPAKQTLNALQQRTRRRIRRLLANLTGPEQLAKLHEMLAEQESLSETDLSPGQRLRLWAWRATRGEPPTSRQTIDDRIRQVRSELADLLESEPQLIDDPAVVALKQSLPAAGETPDVDLDTLANQGPAQHPGWALDRDRSKVEAPIYTCLTPPNDHADFDLAFRRVTPDATASETFYLMRRELSVPIFVALMRQNPALSESMREWLVGSDDKRTGPRTWSWSRGSFKGSASLFNVGHAQGQGPVISPEVQVDGQLPGLTASPWADTPLQHIGLAPALRLAHALNCRLPSDEQWLAALRQQIGQPAVDAWTQLARYEDKNQIVRPDRPPNANLRDARLITQMTYLQEQFSSQFQPGQEGVFEGFGPREPWPISKMMVFPTGEDVFPFFREVDVSDAPGFRDLVGNVAEWCFDYEVGFEDQLAAAAGSLRDVEKLVRRHHKRGSILGGSFMSLPTQAVTEPAAPGGFRIGYADVGLRLAFEIREDPTALGRDLHRALRRVYQPPVDPDNP